MHQVNNITVAEGKMSVQGKYFKNIIEFMERDGNCVEHSWTADGQKKTDKIYTYDEALDLAGRGWYTYGLAAFLILAFQGITLDIFGISVILTGACDLNLTYYQKTILLSMPLLGSMVMAWPWGYAADTQGRRKAMTFSLWGSFILSTISAFSPNWIVLAVLKFGSCSLSSGTQSLGYTLLGESCSQKFRDPFFIIASTSIIVIFGSNLDHTSEVVLYKFDEDLMNIFRHGERNSSMDKTIGYFILNLDIWVDLDFIIFSNWRLLILAYASLLGLSAAFLTFIFESPKFLLNAGHDQKAIEILRNIMRRNGGDDTKYPVKKIVLQETTSLRPVNVPLWMSVRDQTLPLFKPPLLYRTMQLLYLLATIYAVNNGFYFWLPFVMDSFYSSYYENATISGSVCDMIVSSNKLDHDMQACVGTVKDLVLWIGGIQAVVFSVLNVGISFLSCWKRSVLMALILFAFTCGILIPTVSDRMASIILLNGFLISCLGLSIVFSYYVDLIPTSYRATAGCLGVMVARCSALVGSNLVGGYIDSHCKASFYAWSAFVFSGAVVSWFLPPDNSAR